MNGQDFDGWTPLHAAAHWGQKEACEVLLENMCDMGIRNNCVSYTHSTGNNFLNGIFTLAKIGFGCFWIILGPDCVGHF